jgi:hypothetical protein
MTELRHTSFSGEARDDAARSAENARDANVAIGERVLGFVYGPFDYTAQADTTKTIGILCTRRPAGVLLLNAYLSTAPADDLAAVARCNFVWDSVNSVAQVFEPSGLTANSAYNLTFLVVG